jgi:hypothetical protein
VAPSDRTRPATKSDAVHFIGKAREFLSAAEAESLEGRSDSAGLAAIHAGISAGDAVLAYRGGVRSAGQDHRATVDLIVSVMGDAAVGPVKHLRRLVDKKNLVAYEQRRLTQAEAAELCKHASRFIEWAETQLPRR